MGAYGIHKITDLPGPAQRVSVFGGITEAVCTAREASSFDGLRISVITSNNFLLMPDFGGSTLAVIDVTSNIPVSKAPKMRVFGRRNVMTIYHRNRDPLKMFVRDLEPGVDA